VSHKDSDPDREVRALGERVKEDLPGMEEIREELAEKPCAVCDNTGVPVLGVNGGRGAVLLEQCPKCGKRPPNMHTARFRQALKSAGSAQVMTRRKKR
jgi:hypothetical protein